MPVGVCTELWAYEHPETVIELQRAYVEAGSDVLMAPTFSANRIGLEMHGLADRLAELNAGLVAISRRAADGRALVAGDFATTGKPLEPIGPLSYHALLDVYREQIEAVVAAGVEYYAGYKYDYLICSLAFCINGFINGTGHTKLTLITNLVSTYAVRIPACILAGTVWKLGMLGIGYALPIATVAQVIIGFAFYLSGRWRRDIHSLGEAA